jgi:hypothetical protein
MCNKTLLKMNVDFWKRYEFAWKYLDYYYKLARLTNFKFYAHVPSHRIFWHAAGNFQFATAKHQIETKSNFGWIKTKIDLLLRSCNFVVRIVTCAAGLNLHSQLLLSNTFDTSVVPVNNPKQVGQ